MVPWQATVLELPLKSYFLEMEVQKLEDLQQQLVEERERLSEKLEKHEIYQKFMQKVLDQSEEFSETREIIDRYNTLVATHSDLLDREQLNQVICRFSTHMTLFMMLVRATVTPKF